MGKRGIHVVVDGQDLAAHFRNPAGRESGGGAIAAVDGDPQAALADGRGIEGAHQYRQVMIDGVSPLDHGPDVIPGCFLEFVLMVDVQQLGCLRRIEVETICPDELQGVPGRRIVPCGDGNAALCVQPGYRQLQAGSGTHSEVDHLAAGCQQPGGHRGGDHGARWTGVAAHQYAARIKVCGKSLRETDRQLRREGLPDDSPDSADADLKWLHRLSFCSQTAAFHS